MQADIEILFKEYDTLRNEIVVRTSSGYQMLTVGAVVIAALLTWLSSHSARHPMFLGTVTFVVAAFVIAFLVTRRDINAAAKHISRIESDINIRAGKTLLTWETKHGGAAKGWFRLRG
ncbi:MAG: hypothetical protein LAO06_04625 [Acidobacteriia bacterium]|nr:hypothetical protein [Terriglobia bacterium]